MTKPATGKTPYEIRLELLQMAQAHLQSQFDQQMVFVTEAMKMASDAQLMSINDFKALMPASFTFQDIIAKANELYGFVQKKD